MAVRFDWNFITRVTSRVMPNSYPEWQNFQFEPNNNYRFFFLHTLLSTIAFRLEYVLFYQFYAQNNYFFFRSRNVRLATLLYVEIETFGGNWRENDIKTSKLISKHQNRHPYVMHESRLTPPHVRRCFLAPVGFTEISVGYAKIYFLVH